MRSLLEERWADYLDDQGFAWTYEPGAFQLDPTWSYTPDFVIQAGPYCIIVEIKPTLDHALREIRLPALARRVENCCMVIWEHWDGQWRGYIKGLPEEMDAHLDWWHEETWLPDWLAEHGAA